MTTIDSAPRVPLHECRGRSSVDIDGGSLDDLCIELPTVFGNKINFTFIHSILSISVSGIVSVCYLRRPVVGGARVGVASTDPGVRSRGGTVDRSRMEGRPSSVVPRRQSPWPETPTPSYRSRTHERGEHRRAGLRRDETGAFRGGDTPPLGADSLRYRSFESTVRNRL